MLSKNQICEKLEELKECEKIIIYHYVNTYVYEVFYTNTLINCPEHNCLKCSVGNRIIRYDNIKDLAPSL